LVAVVIELACESGSCAPDGDLAGALVSSCSATLGAGGCAIDSPDGGTLRAERSDRAPEDATVPPGRRVFVSFSAGLTRVRVELDGAAPGSSAAVRVVTFRASDPSLERFRAAGLVVAGLVVDAGHSPAPSMDRTDDLPGDRKGRALELSIVGRLSWPSDLGRLWYGATLGVDVPVPLGPTFVTLSIGYDQTSQSDTNGVTEQRATFGVGPGVGASFFEGKLDVRGRVALTFSELRAGVHPPGTTLEDAGERTLVGGLASVDGDVPFGSTFGLVARGTLEGWSSQTTIRVAGRPAAVVPAGAYSLGVGFRLRIP
jgi:hypothetical protein